MREFTTSSGRHTRTSSENSMGNRVQNDGTRELSIDQLKGFHQHFDQIL